MTSGARHIFTLIVLLAMFGTNECRGEEEKQSPIAVIGAHLEGRLDDDPASGYNRLMREIIPNDRAFAVYQKYPLVRALRQVELTPRACLFPASVKSTVALTSLQADMLVESDTVDYVSAHIMTRPGGVEINSKLDIYGRTIAVQRGVEYAELFADRDRFSVLTTPDDKTALRMVQAGRVDGMFGWNPDALIIASNNRIELPDFNPDFILFETTTHLVCKKGVGAEPLIEHVNQRIAALRQSGELRAMLGPHARLEK